MDDDHLMTCGVWFILVGLCLLFWAAVLHWLF